jgi:alkylated DNA repair dioxygenase AlkB
MLADNKSFPYMQPDAPAGFVYRPELIDETEEQALLRELRQLEFYEVKMHGVVARRRVMHFGWRYGYESWRIEPGPPIPEFLLPLRQRAAELAGVEAEQFAEVLVTEYPPGAGIGWHRDAPMFGVVAGISLLGACRFRFQRGKAERRQTYAFTLEPRSAYVLTGAARSEWQHSIPPTKTLRYSVTFRTLRHASTANPRTMGSRADAGAERSAHGGEETEDL